MKFPSYWSKATIEERDQDGKEVSASCWHWSDTSKEEAHQSAMAAARQLLQRLMSGQQLGAYAYGQRPLREEVLQTHAYDQGQPSIAVTRNSYGVLVLNTAQVMFIDLDFAPIPSGANLRYFFSRLFGGKGPSPEAKQEAEAKSDLTDFLSSNPTWGMRLYRTCAGLRILVTHSLFDPSADSTRAHLESVGSDPLYIRLCRDQECFRARLTPKPWRCGHIANRVGWPHETERAKTRFKQWLAEYDECQSDYATCRFVGTLGVSSVDRAVQPVIEMHDELTRCHEDLPLA